MNAPPIEDRDELTLMKVSRAIQRKISVIAKLDGKQVRDVTDEALLEYISRRGLVVSIDSPSSVAQSNGNS